MPFNGAGVYSPPGADFPAVAGTLIQSTKFNNIINDIATALSLAILKDGQQVVTANIPMAGFVFTGMGTGVAARTRSARIGDIQDGDILVLGTVAGTNTITASLSPAITAYTAGMRVFLLPANAVTGAATLNINSVGAIAIKKRVGGSIVANVANDMVAGGCGYWLTYDVTGSDCWLMDDQPISSKGADVASAGTLDLTNTTGNVVDVTGTTTITAITLPEGQRRTLRFTGILTLTNGASLVLPSAASIVTAAGDMCDVIGYAAGVVRVPVYSRLDGVALVGNVRASANTTSGTSVDITLAMTGVNSFVVTLAGVSTNGTSAFLFQLGDAGGIETTVYTSIAQLSSATFLTATNGFVLATAAVAANTYSGRFEFTRHATATNLWIMSGALIRDDVAVTIYDSVGFKALSEELTTLRLTTAGGANTFDAGSMNVLYNK